MEKDTRLLGQLVELRGMVDRRVIVFLVRALLIDAPPEKRQVVARFLDLLREQFEAAVAASEDEETQGHARVALMHFEGWATDLDQMLHEIQR